MEKRSLLVSDFKRLAEQQSLQELGEGVDVQDFPTLERKFWKNLTRFPPIYGADLTGSLFERSGCSWNLGHIRSVCSFLCLSATAAC
jgi:jumonji domain-containing protein 2